MKKIKNGLFGGLGVIFGLFLMSGCQQNAANDPTIATYQQGKVTEEQFYQELKASPTSKTILANLLIYTALDQSYGKEVSKTQVQKEYQSYQQQYGDQFTSFLSQNGFTKKTFKRSLRTNLLSEVALKDLKPVSNAQLKTAWKKYRPQVTVQHILVTDENTAKEVIQQLQAGADFSQLAKTYSVDNATKDNGGKLAAFDSTDRTLDSTFKDAAYALKVGAFTTTPVKVTNGYEVIKVVKNAGKGSFKAAKATLTKSIYANWSRNATTMQAVISEVLKREKVVIKDADLKSALNTYKTSISTKATE
ncbi:peptidylprolyl isomerase PrsA [Lapidilactobacillus luobeiensis]|uniref:peptidylprolyl isomerase PrsA n=1 Tax=Lapidilactobacillus luobeiensis TaxID=2950371 RepID=UPI0021C4BEF7|nr:peptidylprolyl isomerase PrsA [Lapidilactobacillus luobeiensis]